jgi:hypothetical protein
MKFGPRWKRFAEDPFAFIDELNLTVKGNNLNLFQKYHRIQATMFWFAIVCLAGWLICGFDSSIFQPVEALFRGIPLYLLGHWSWSQVVNLYNSYYGKEMHWSAFVIYFLMWFGMSKTWERAGIVKCKNILYSFAGMFVAVAIFEFSWMYSFAFFQNQFWVVTWRMPQLRILLQNSGFAFAGGACLLFMLVDRWNWKGTEQLDRRYFFQARDWRLWLCVGLSLATWIFWIYYPFPTHQFSVLLKNGVLWHSSKLFPQTLYTINLNPGGSSNSGVWYWFADDPVHAVNTGVKALMAYTVYLALRVKRAAPGIFN